MDGMERIYFFLEQSVRKRALETLFTAPSIFSYLGSRVVPFIFLNPFQDTGHWNETPFRLYLETAYLAYSYSIANKPNRVSQLA